MPESRGALPPGPCLPEPGESVLSPGTGGELGKCAGVRPGWAAHPATGGALGEARGQRAAARVTACQPLDRPSTYPPPALTLVLLLSMAALFPLPAEAIFPSDSLGKKHHLLCGGLLKIIAKLLRRNAATSPKLQSAPGLSSEACIRAFRPCFPFLVVPAGWSFPGDFHQSSGDR